jgi:NAD(P)-dependent dehydrogenase (short-subunit alcohol dehydrogenase family)
MKSFENRFAVTTGGGSGMGRHLVIQLAAEGCSVAFCDVIKESIDETIKLAMATAKGGAKVSGHVCDTSKEAEVLRFREEALKAHGKTQVS